MEWISVKDRLPENEGKYLCWDVPYSSSTSYPTFGHFQDGKFYMHIADDWSNVTHWMPLPEPPK